MNTNKDWLDIASAPKDGTEILAWRRDCGQFIASYTSPSAFPLTQKELDEMDEADLFTQDWFTQWPHACRLEGSEAPTLWQPMPTDPCATCGGHGMVGGLTQHSGYEAEPCPDCSPASTVATEGEKAYGSPADVARRIEQYLYHDGRKNSATQLLYEAMKALRRPAPAAGDALDRDQQRLALWQAIRDITIGNLHDDKLILANLHKAGYVIALAAIAQQSQLKGDA